MPLNIGPRRVVGLTRKGGGSTLPPYPSATTGFVVDGDSTSQGPIGIGGSPAWPFVLAGAITSLGVVDRAVSGERLSQMLANYSTDVAPYYAVGRNTLIILAGVNDILGDGKTDADLNTDIRAYCALAYATGFKIFVGTLMPVSGYAGWNTTKNGYLNAHNQNLRSNYREFAHGLIDFNAIAGLDPTNRLQSIDGLHWCAPIHAKMAELARISTGASLTLSSVDTKLNTTPLTGSASFENYDRTFVSVGGGATVISDTPITSNVFFTACLDRAAAGFVGLGLADTNAAAALIGFNGNHSLGAFQDRSIWFAGVAVKAAGGASLVGNPLGIAVRYVSASEAYAWVTFDGTTYYGAGGATKTKTQVEAFDGGINLSTMFAGGAVYAALGANAASLEATANFGAATLPFTKPTGFAFLN